jgi:hypothetical protein
MRCAAPGLDGLDGVCKRPFQGAPANGPEHEAEHPPLEVLADPHHDHVDGGGAVGPEPELGAKTQQLPFGEWELRMILRVFCCSQAISAIQSKWLAKRDQKWVSQ